MRCIVVWTCTVIAHFDTTTGFLGGMALAGARGWWETGLGARPRWRRCGHRLGGRDLEEAELAGHRNRSAAPRSAWENLAARLDDVVQQRPVFVHLDCDVLEPGIVATDYRSFGGLNLDDIYACARVLAASEVLGSADSRVRLRPLRLTLWSSCPARCRTRCARSAVRA